MSFKSFLTPERLIFYTFAQFFLKNMRFIRGLIKNILLLAVLSSFLMSTSGFVITRHICSHHSAETIIGDVSSDGCCEIEKAEAKTTCCVVKTETASCKTDECCRFEKNYVRLSETFITSEKTDFSKKTQPTSYATLKDMAPVAKTASLPEKEIYNAEQEKKPKAKKYLLFHQVKVEPPLL